MIIGTPREVKDSERRVGLTAPAVDELARRGHTILIESGAGVGAGISDDMYRHAGGTIVDAAADVFADADMIVKVKEPQAPERAMLRKGQILFTYLHLAPDAPQTTDLIESGATAIAYETVTGHDGGLPLLAPMSKVAGRMSIQAAAWALETTHGGAGMLLGGVPGVPPANVVIIGGGVVGSNAATMAVGMGANVTVLDRNNEVMEHLEQRFGAGITTIYSTSAALEELVTEADVVIGAVLVPGAKAPKLVTADMVTAMRSGSVLVDVAIDQGGAFETSHATTHSDPIYVVDDVVHYAVANMPGGVPKTSTYALVNATLPYVLKLADRGLDAARTDPHLRNGVNIHAGDVTEPAVAEAHGTSYVAPEIALGA